MTVQPSREEFRDKAGEGNLIPVYTEVYADLETPVSAYLKLRRVENTILLIKTGGCGICIGKIQKDFGAVPFGSTVAQSGAY